MWTANERRSSAEMGMLIVTTFGVSYHVRPSSSKPGTVVLIPLSFVLVLIKANRGFTACMGMNEGLVTVSVVVL